MTPDFNELQSPLQKELIQSPLQIYIYYMDNSMPCWVKIFRI